MQATTVDPDFEKALSKAKLELMASRTAVFFATIMLRLAHGFTLDIATACTNGTHVWYNPQFFMACTPKQRVGLILHELLHTAFHHMLRLNGRDPRIWNMACDYVINLIILRAGFELPEGGLVDWKYEDWLVDDVYDDLIQQQTDPDDLPMDDLMEPGTDPEQVQKDIDNILVEAAIAAQKAGDEAWGAVPGALQRYIDDLLNPQLPMGALLAQFIRKTRRVKRTYRKPKRHFLPDWVIKTPDGKGLEDGAIHVDVSGSIKDKDVSVTMTEIYHVLQKLKPDSIMLGQFDTQLTVDEVKGVDDFRNIAFRGGGGTNITPVLEWAQEHKPNWLVIFTDGYFKWPNIDPQVPIIWLVHSHPSWKAPIGQTVHIELK